MLSLKDFLYMDEVINFSCLSFLRQVNSSLPIVHKTKYSYRVKILSSLSFEQKTYRSVSFQQCSPYPLLSIETLKKPLIGKSMLQRTQPSFAKI